MQDYIKDEIFNELAQDVDEWKSLDTSIDMDLTEDEDTLQEDEVTIDELSQVTEEITIVVLTVDSKLDKMIALFKKDEPVTDKTFWERLMGLYEYYFGKEQLSPKDNRGMRSRLIKPKPKQRQPAMIKKKGERASPKQEFSNSIIKGIMLIAMTMELITADILIDVLMTRDVRVYFRSIPFAYVIVPIILLILLDFGFSYVPTGRQAPCSFVLLNLTVLSMIFLNAMISCHLYTNVMLYVVIIRSVVATCCFCLACFNYPFVKEKLLVKHMASVATGMFIFILMIDWIARGFMGFLSLFVFITITALLVYVFLLQIGLLMKGKTTKLKQDDTTLGGFLIYTALIDVPLKKLMRKIMK